MAHPLILMQQAGVKRDQHWAVRGLNFTIERGEIVTIVGPNGAGKSYLLTRPCRYRSAG